MSQIVLVRHAESEANVAAAWQGRGNAALSPTGRSQVEALAKRMNGRNFDAVVSSPLNRTYETATAVLQITHEDDDMIEIDLGKWVGDAFNVGPEKGRELLRSIHVGVDERIGHIGKKMREVAARAWAVIDVLSEREGPDGSA